jgi:glutathione synthase/RimK-type ligase-like ATP-grasp enzyme
MRPKRQPKILLVTTTADIASDYVVLKLSRLEAKFYRINTDRFPLSARSAIMIGNTTQSPAWLWRTPESGIQLDELKCIWFRRHRLPAMPPEIENAHAEYCLRESEWFLRGALYAQDVAWMSHPARVAVAESKTYQLSVARSVGFRVPETLITNCAQDVRSFYEQLAHGMVAKPLRLGYFDYGERKTCIFTSKVEWSDLQDDGPIGLAPVIYQEMIPKLFDIRVTIVGQEVFSAAIDSQSVPSARIDWRRTDTNQLKHTVHELPSRISTLCLTLVAELGLSFGALDLVLTPEGEYVFLEVNPNGQWAWIEDILGLPISESIASWLLAHARVR